MRTIRTLLNSMKGRPFNEIEDLLAPEEEEETLTDENGGTRKLHSKGTEYLGNKRKNKKNKKKNNSKGDL